MRVKIINITKNDVIRIFINFFNSKIQSKTSIHEEKEKEIERKQIF